MQRSNRAAAGLACRAQRAPCCNDAAAVHAAAAAAPAPQATPRALRPKPRAYVLPPRAASLTLRASPWARTNRSSRSARGRTERCGGGKRVDRALGMPQQLCCSRPKCSASKAAAEKLPGRWRRAGPNHRAAPTPLPPQGKYKPLKLSCVHRAMLLTDLYQAMAAAAALAKCSVALRILGCAAQGPRDARGAAGAGAPAAGARWKCAAERSAAGAVCSRCGR